MNDDKRQAALEQVKMYQANDWEVAEETPEYFLLKRNTAKVGVHILLLLFFWWTLGIANLIYWMVCKQSKKIIK